MSFELDRATAASLHAMCSREGVTPNAALVALWGALLARLGGDDEIVVAQAHSLRHDERLLVPHAVLECCWQREV